MTTGTSPTYRVQRRGHPAAVAARALIVDVGSETDRSTGTDRVMISARRLNASLHVRV